MWKYTYNMDAGVQPAPHGYVHRALSYLYMRPGIGQNTSCASGACLTSRPKGRSQPRELWFSIYSCIHTTETAHMHMYH